MAKQLEAVLSESEENIIPLLKEFQEQAPVILNDDLFALSSSSLHKVETLFSQVVLSF